MNDYFAFSQQVKKEIESRDDILRTLAGHLSGKDVLEWFAEGSIHRIYSLGRLESGLWVALRENIYIDGYLPEIGMLIYESCCKSAECKHAAGERVPKFCVGGCIFPHPTDIDESCMAFLLTEDLSEGGRWWVRDGGGEIGFVIKDGKWEAAKVDIGAENETSFLAQKAEIVSGTFDVNSLKYFSPAARLNIRAD